MYSVHVVSYRIGEGCVGQYVASVVVIDRVDQRSLRSQLKPIRGRARGARTVPRSPLVSTGRVYAAARGRSARSANASACTETRAILWRRKSACERQEKSAELPSQPQSRH